MNKVLLMYLTELKVWIRNECDVMWHKVINGYKDKDILFEKKIFEGSQNIDCVSMYRKKKTYNISFKGLFTIYL